jgi:hypothetical protein
MATEPALTRITAAKASEITRNYTLKKELEPLLADEPSPLQFLDRLLFEEKHVPEAVDFLVYALPKREAVWWGCLCVELFLDVAVLREERRQALRSVVRWVMEPTEEHRRATEAPAKVVGPTLPSGSLALAVFESGGSIQPPDRPAIEPHPLATAQGVRNTLHILPTRVPGDQLMACYRSIVAIGIGLAQGQSSRQ